MDNPFPKGSESFLVGQRAIAAFMANKPETWVVRTLDGDDDFGIDAQVQLIDNQTYDVQELFHLQIKGTQQGRNSTSSNCRVRIKTATLNNYLSRTTLVILIFCDLATVPRRVLYLHLTEAIQAKLGGNRYFNGDDKYHIFEIPAANRLTCDLDVSRYIDDYAREVSTARAAFFQKANIGQSTRLRSLQPNSASSEAAFEQQRRIDHDFYVCSRGRVRLDAFLPAIPDLTLSCLLQFKIPGIDDCMISFSEKSTIELFSGYRAPVDDRARRFVVSLIKPGVECVFVQLGNCRLQIKIDVLCELCDLLDDLADTYVLRRRNIESFISASGFTPARNYRNGFRLLSIKRGLWSVLHRFADAHRFDAGDGAWDIFGHDYYSLRINAARSRQNELVASLVISPETQDDTDFSTEDDEVWLVWNTLEQLDYKFAPEDEEIWSGIMSVQRAHEWLLKELFPRVAFEHRKPISRIERFMSQIQDNYGEFLESFDYQQYVCMDGRRESVADFTAPTPTNLVKLVRLLQRYYALGREDIFVHREALADLYRGLAILVGYAEPGEMGYIGSKLDLSSTEKILASHELLSKAAMLSDGTSNSFLVELALRGYCAAAEHFADEPPASVVVKIFERLEEIRAVHEHHRVLDRASEKAYLGLL